MYVEGNIIYFKPFYFKNGNIAKPKCFIVLKTIQENILLATLPTSKDFIPEGITIDFGCIELPDSNFNCFVISNTQAITECNKKFDFTTYIYGHQLDIYEISMLKNVYKIEGSDYEVYGKIKFEIFDQLLKCLKTSKSVKYKYLKLLK